jgi:hypothetical protein
VGKVERFLSALEKLRRAAGTVVMSVRPHGTTQLPTGQIFMKFDI